MVAFKSFWIDSTFFWLALILAIMSVNQHSSLHNYTSVTLSCDGDRTKDLGWKWIYLTLIILIRNSLQAFTIPCLAI
jgi:hypothetical protein